MATGKRYYWLKLKESFMTSDTVDFLMSQKDGANYVVLYQMLCLKTINTSGRFSRTIGEIVIPYDVNKIQRDCKWFSLDTIRVALELYKRFGLVYEEQDGTLVITDHHNLIGRETDWKDQKAAQREKKLPKLQGCKRLNANSLLLPSGNIQTVDEKRYGGHGMKAFDLSGGKCEMCGSYEDLCIHHANGYSNEQEDLYILCKTCHGIAHSASTAPDWLHHSWVACGQESGQEGGQVHQDVHTDIRDKILEIRDKDIRGTKNEVICAEVNSALVAEITLVDGTKHFITEEDYEKDRKAFPAVDVKQEYLKMERWGDANPKKRKTRNGIKRFINAWLEREQNRGGATDGGKEPKGTYDRRNNRSRDEEDGPLTHYTLTEHFVGER